MDDLAGFFLLGGLFLVIVGFVVEPNKREFIFYTLSMVLVFLLPLAFLFKTKSHIFNEFPGDHLDDDSDEDSEGEGSRPISNIRVNIFVICGILIVAGVLSSGVLGKHWYLSLSNLTDKVDSFWDKFILISNWAVLVVSAVLIIGLVGMKILAPNRYSRWLNNCPHRKGIRGTYLLFGMGLTSLSVGIYYANWAGDIRGLSPILAFFAVLNFRRSLYEKPTRSTQMT